MGKSVCGVLGENTWDFSQLYKNAQLFQTKILIEKSSILEPPIPKSQSITIKYFFIKILDA